jgi:hypothetical protein
MCSGIRERAAAAAKYYYKGSIEKYQRSRIRTRSGCASLRGEFYNVGRPVIVFLFFFFEGERERKVVSLSLSLHINNVYIRNYFGVIELYRRSARPWKRLKYVEKKKNLFIYF